jgi:hypothetical protein
MSGTSTLPANGARDFPRTASFSALANATSSAFAALAAWTAVAAWLHRECDPEASVTNPDPEPYRHPIGTLAIVGAYGALFAVGWLLVYVYVYLSRGPVTP